MTISLPSALPMILILFSCTTRASADAIVTGSDFCDQCRDGERSLLDYPLSGAKVAVACAGSDGQATAYVEDTTGLLGTYGVRLEGGADMSRCYARVVSGPSTCGSGSGSGPAQELKLLLRVFDMEFYAVDPLLSTPEQPMGFCQRPTPLPSAPPVPPAPITSPPAILPPPVVPSPPLVAPVPPVLWQPPPASACPSRTWTVPEYRCYWKVVGPSTKVAVAFGLIAAQRYGMDITLWEGLQGRGDLYRTLLREGTTALLNSYNNLQFFYPTLMVIDHMNWALVGSPQQALSIALRFRRANSGASGYGAATCNFAPCTN